MNGWTILKLLATYQAGVTFKENVERHVYWKAARAYADEAGKPLLVVGMQRHRWQPSNGDITLDLDPVVEEIPGGVCGDECAMPFADKEFGACYNAHTLEHLADVDAVQAAVSECLRVADIAFFLGPSPYDLYSNLFCPSHNLRLWFDQVNNKITVTDNGWRTGLGMPSGVSQPFKTGLVKQAIFLDKAPKIIKSGRGYIASDYGVY